MSNITTRFQADLSGLVLTQKMFNRKQRYLLSCYSLPIRGNSVSVYSSTSMIGQGPSTTVNHSVLQQSPLIQRKQNWLSSRVQVMRSSVSRDHTTQWSGSEGKKQRT